MTLKNFLLATATLIALPGVAFAQSDDKPLDEGFYVGAQVGANNGPASTLSGTNQTNTAHYNWSPNGLIEGGYRFGEGLRLGAEFGYTATTVGNITGGDATGRSGGKGETNAFTFMGTAYYDFNTNSPWRPFIGAGIGVAHVRQDGLKDLFYPGRSGTANDTGFAYQASAGLAYAIDANTDVTLTYRYLATADDLSYSPGGNDRFHAPYENHSVLIGLRYTFGESSAPVAPPAPAPKPVAAPAPAPVPPPPPPAPAPSISRNFTVFFDFDKADLTADARTVLDNVAKDAKAGHILAVKVTGYTDRSGSDSYNLKLSQHRADAVRAYLVTKGITAGEIAVDAKGESDPLVPTADGVREPSNRRAVIIFP